MPRNPTPRIAKLIHVSSNPDRPYIVGKITHGPLGEIDKTVNIVISKSQIPTLRAFLDRIEAKDHGS